MTNKDLPPEIDQSLHGYSRGHGLLASSIALPARDERHMLRLSDMSGHSMVKGFETYLTGYPLSDSGYYVLARTWHAPELSRPGCVWTHSLILKISDLDGIQYAGQLNQLFRRPTENFNSDAYKQKIMLGSRQNPAITNDKVGIREKKLSEILNSIYGNPEKQVFVISETALNLESFVLRIWENQWASFQKDFIFCTGSIENRSYSDISFDLQIIPEHNRNSIQRKNVGEIFVDDSPSQELSYPTWVEFLTRELLQISPHNALTLKEFLKLAGSNLKQGRTQYAKLVTIYAELTQESRNNNTSAAKALEAVAMQFPDPFEVPELKIWLFGPLDNINRHNQIHWTEAEKWIALCTSKYADAINRETLQMQPRVKSLLKDDWHSVEKIFTEILAKGANQIGEDFVMIACKNLDSQTAHHMAERSGSVLPMLTRYFPNIASSKAAASLDRDKQSELLDVALSSQELTPEIVEGLIGFALDNQIDYFSKKVFHNWDDLAVAATLNWIKKQINLTKYYELAAPWRDCLGSRPSQLMRWLSMGNIDENSIGIVRIIIDLINPNSKEILEYGSKIWLDLTPKIAAKLSDSDKLNCYCFFFAIALNTNDDASPALFAETFLTVHNAERASHLPYHRWEQFAYRLPDLRWPSWDKCERLRRGFFDQFFEKHWDSSFFFRGSDQQDVFESIIQYCLDKDRRRKYLQKMIIALSPHSSILSKEQNQILKRHWLI